MAGLGYAGPSSRTAGMSEFNFLTARNAVTVAGLPTLTSTPVPAALGQIRVVSDATAPAVGSAPAGGGTARALVWFNGTAWRVIGI